MPRKPSRSSSIVQGGLLAGVLDLAAAMAQFVPRGVAPIRIPQAIASGLLGPAAYGGGAWTAALGVALHFVIALTAAALYVWASRPMGVLRVRTVPCGLLYGVLVYGVMQLAVLPLSRAKVTPPTAAGVAEGLAIHMLCVGLPIAFAARRR